LTASSPASPTRVLVVDDDPAITQIYQEVLRSEGYAVLTAGTCADAMTQMDSVQGDVQVLVVDFGLPDGDGADFVRAAVAKYGERPTMYVSGWTDEFWQLQDTPGRWIILRKPVSIKKLFAAVRWLSSGGEKPLELDGQ
jgi:DNA-binding response OmpR family regulator